MNKKRVTYIDPPGGWQYGFPKIIPQEAFGNVRLWLVENGYPQSEIDSYGKYFDCRYWTDEVDDD